jgi:hypothetical protein
MVYAFSIKMKGEIFVEDLINMVQIGTVISEEKIFFVHWAIINKNFLWQP